MPDPIKDRLNRILPEQKQPDTEQNLPLREINKEDEMDKKPIRKSSNNFFPIVMSFALFVFFGTAFLHAQFDLDVSLGATYSDNVFQLSEYDLQRFDQDSPSLAYANTTDDLNLAVKADLAYPLRYKWWKFTPSLTATIAQNVSNTDKYKRNAILRFRTDRYYWNCTVLYGYYPYNYVRSYVDRDGTGTMEKYSYARNLYRGDLNIKPLKGTTVHLQARYDQYFYNQYWTEFDGNATTLGVGLRHSFPVFSVGGNYSFRSFDNTMHEDRDASYDSNIYSGDLRLNAMPLSENKPQGTTWYPALALSYEERFFQSADSWYGGRTDKIYNTNASLNFDINARWNLLLDYSHTFRNVDTPVSAVRRAREYGENTLSATVKYSF